MKIIGSWDVESSTRPKMFHRVTQYDTLPYLRCSCEGGAHGAHCRHVKQIEEKLAAERAPAAVDEGWQTTQAFARRGLRVELQKSLALGQSRIVEVLLCNDGHRGVCEVFDALARGREPALPESRAALDAVRRQRARAGRHP